MAAQGTLCFIPGGPFQNRVAASAATSGALLGAAPALADPIGDAAKKLADTSYPFAKEVYWTRQNSEHQKKK